MRLLRLEYIGEDTGLRYAVCVQQVHLLLQQSELVYMYMQCKFFRAFKIRGFAYLLKKILKYCTRCSVNMQKLNPDNS